MTKPLITPEHLQKVNDFLDYVIEKLRLKNDAALSRALDVAPPVVSKTRSGALGATPTLLLRIHDASDATITFADMRARLGIPPLTPAHGTV